MLAVERSPSDVLDDLNPREKFEKRFSFVSEETTRKNIAIAFEYIVFLIAVADQDGHRSLIKSSLYKDAVIYTGIIIESCLNYVLRSYISSSRIKLNKIQQKEWVVKENGIIYKLNSKRRIRYVIEEHIFLSLKKSLQFVEINKACLDGGILTKKEFELADGIREARNKLHIMGLKQLDNTYTKEKLDKTFKNALVILTKVEKKIKAL